MKHACTKLTLILGGLAIARKCNPRAAPPWRSYIRVQQHAPDFFGHRRKAMPGTLPPACAESQTYHGHGIDSRPPVAMNLLCLRPVPLFLSSAQPVPSPTVTPQQHRQRWQPQLQRWRQRRSGSRSSNRRQHSFPGSSSQLPANQQPAMQPDNCYGVSNAATSQPAVQIQPQQHAVN